MSNEMESRSAAVRFVDSFFDERNIKWMLTIGMLILFGSSLMLVTSRWETYAPAWKHLILLAYTTAIFSMGEVAGSRLNLHRTATVLKSLTLLLIPINFLALHRIWKATDVPLLELGFHTLLLAMTCAVSWTATQRIILHFLRKPQPTFVFCYLILAVAGAIVPSLPNSCSVPAALVLWGVFAIGTIKVNRHIFWLTEEHRLPRVFGFFPILLLGTQFLTLIWCSHLAQFVSMDWLGLGLAMISLPILMTADTVYRVFQQRSGNLVRPVPASIIVPIVVGLILCAAGICLSATGLPRPMALVPTAALTTFVLAIIAKRTEKTGFVWAMLATMTLTYNFSPTYFLDLARMLIQISASAVNEQRLPYAFYGLTYLPLLLTTTCLASYCSGNRNRLFGRPWQAFSIGVSLLLLAVSYTHPKAIFPVGLVLLPIFSIQTVLFTSIRRYLLLPAIASFLTASFGLTYFIENVIAVDVSGSFPFACLSLASLLLLMPGRYVDGWIRRTKGLVESGDSRTVHNWANDLCQKSSVVTSTLAAGLWVVAHFVLRLDAISIASGILLGGLLVTHSLIWLRRGLAESTICFLLAFVLLSAASCDCRDATLLSIATFSLLGCWLLGLILRTSRISRLQAAFAAPLLDVSTAGLTLTAIFFVLALIGSSFIYPAELPWVCIAATMVWTFDAARRRSSPMLSTLGCVGVLVFESGLVTRYFSSESILQWVPAIWTTTAIVVMPISTWMYSRLKQMPASIHEAQRWTGFRSLAIPTLAMTLAVPLITAIVSLIVFIPPIQLAGMIAVMGLVLAAWLLRSSGLRQFSWTLVNWQIVRAIAGIGLRGVNSVFDLSSENVLEICLPVAATAGLSLLVIELFNTRQSANQDQISPVSEKRFWELQLYELHTLLLRVVTVLVLFISLRTVDLSTNQVLIALVAFLALIGSEILAACRTEHSIRVWNGIIIAAFAAGYLNWFKLIEVSSSSAMFTVLIIGFASWTIGRISRDSARMSVLSDPLLVVSGMLPIVSVSLAVYRDFTVSPSDWLGINSLAVLFAAAFYFWRGVEQKRRSLIVLAAGILNLALTLLWRELNWTDPQCFMIPLGASILMIVQMLKPEIPKRLHNPLTYLGALIILVSPTFHIVGGSWLHLLALMVLSVAITLVSIGLRVRAMMYTGTAFLIADLIAMVCRGTIDYPHLLWLGGILLGASVLGLAAACERYREELAQRLRLLAAGLEGWE